MPSIYHQEKGSGFPVLLIHGFCETQEVWNLVAAKLPIHFRTISIDLPGFGKSSPMPTTHSIDEVADKVLHFLENDLKIDTCMIFGHSLGGYVALSMVDKKPWLFSGLGLVHSTAYADPDERKTARNKVIEFVRSHGVPPFIQSFIPPLFHDQANPHIVKTVELASRTPLTTLISYTEAMRDRPDRTGVLRTFSKPGLFIAGQEDKVIAVEAVHEQATFLKSHSLVILKGVGHMGMLENVEDTAKAIRNFLEQNV